MHIYMSRYQNVGTHHKHACKQSVPYVIILLLNYQDMYDFWLHKHEREIPQINFAKMIKVTWGGYCKWLQLDEFFFLSDRYMRVTCPSACLLLFVSLDIAKAWHLGMTLTANTLTAGGTVSWHWHLTLKSKPLFSNGKAPKNCAPLEPALINLTAKTPLR